MPGWPRRELAWWRRNRRTGLTGLIALVGLSAVTLGPAAAVTLLATQVDQPEEPTQVNRIGQPVPSGPVTFIVHEVRCGPDEQRAEHGRLCEVTLGVRNEGTSDITVPSLAQSLHVVEGARHQPIEDGTGDLETLAPAEAASVILRYDLPLGTTISHLEVRPDTYAQGQPVAVGVPYPLLTPD